MLNSPPDPKLVDPKLVDLWKRLGPVNIMDIVIKADSDAKFEPFGEFGNFGDEFGKQIKY